MRHAATLFCAAAGLTGSASPALAQLDGPPLVQKGPRADRQFASMAACVVDGQRAEAARLLDVAPGGEGNSRAVFELLRDAPFCVPQMSMTKAPSATWRGAIAEALYAKSYSDMRALAVSDAADRPAWLAVPVYAAYDVAQCAAQKAPEAADRVVRAKRRSPEENAAVAALLPALRECGRGRKVDFDRVTIHGMVAEGLFRARGGYAAAAGKQ